MLQYEIGSSICCEGRVVWNVGEWFYSADNHGRCRRSVREDGKRLGGKDAGWWTLCEGKMRSCPIEFRIVGFQPVGSKD